MAVCVTERNMSMDAESSTSATAMHARSKMDRGSLTTNKGERTLDHTKGAANERRREEGRGRGGRGIVCE
jgi:hypothetical protein